MESKTLCVVLVLLLSGSWAVYAGEKEGSAVSVQGKKIVLHTNLKPTGKFRTYSYYDTIRYCIGNAEGYPKTEKSMIRPYFNPFVLMLHLGFARHRPVSISPDTIWLLICNGFALHADIEGEELQKKLFPGRKKEKLRLEVRRDNFVKGRNNPWEDVFDEFTNQMGVVMANDMKAVLTDRFSTTGKAELAAFNVTFMKTMSRSFHYDVMTLCGIPSIYLEGKPKDWDAAAQRAEKLRGYGCDWWVDRLKPILKEFSAASRGKINKKFWCSIYKVDEDSGGSKSDGWCLDFFPYTRKYVRVAKGKYVEKWVPNKKRTPMFPSALPATMATAPFEWHFGRGPSDPTYKMVFVAGFVGISMNEKTKGLRTEIGWAVVEDKKTHRAKVKNAAKDMMKDLDVLH